ncbi:MAG TPA: ABC transporter substrate-binding protein [Chloroflexota bacterium]
MARAWRLGILAALTLAACGPSAAGGGAPAKPAAPAAAVPTAAAPAAPAAASSASAQPAAPAAAAVPQPPVRLKVSTQRLTSDGALIYADEKGYLAEQGVEVEFVDVATGQDVIAPLANSQLDVAVGAVSPGLFNAIARGIDIKLVATKGATAPEPNGAFSGSIWIVLAPDVAASGAIKDYADLRGTNVALSIRGSSLEVILDRALQHGGLTLDDVEIKTLGYADMLPALVNRQVDVALELEPFVALGTANGSLVKWKSAAEIHPGEQSAVLLYGPSILQMAGNAGNRFMVAYTRSLRAYNDAFGPKGINRAEMIESLTRNTALKDPAIYDKIGLGYINPDCYISVDGMKYDIDWYVSHGYVQQPPDLGQIVDNHYCDYAIQQLGHYQP